MWSHPEECEVFQTNFINEISVILNKQCNFNVNHANKDKTLIQWHSSQLLTIGQLFPHTAAPPQIYHFSEYNLVSRHANLTVSSGGALEKLFNLASLYATRTGCTVRPWSWSQHENPGRWSKHKGGQAVYPKLIHEKVVRLFTHKVCRLRNPHIYLKKFELKEQMNFLLW